jgi:hypothetical protein
MGIGASEDGYTARDEAKHNDGFKLSALLKALRQASTASSA